ncbi:MAG: hypothetical protein GY940_40445 [bacterium]|nr:hypothetical protein [bacterium]
MTTPDERKQEPTKEVGQTRVLFRHFMKRFVSGDSLELDDQRTEFMVFIIVFTSLWGMYMADSMGRFTFTKTLMTVSGIFCVTAWEHLLLDIKDFRNLTVLPVKRRTLYLSKLFNSLVMVGGISISFGLFATLIYTWGHYSSGGEDWGSYLLFLLLANFLCSLVVFFLVASVQSFLMLIFRGSFQGKVSLWVQMILILGFVSIQVLLPGTNTAPPQESGIFPVHYLFPSYWFDGFHEFLMGSTQALHRSQFLLALSGVTMFLGLYMSSLPLSLKRYRGEASGKKGKQKNPSRTGFRGSGFPGAHWLKHRVFYRYILGNSTQRAVYYFFIAHLNRSRKHKMKQLLFMAISIGIVLFGIAYQIMEKGTIEFGKITHSQLGISFTLFFLMLLGMRTLVEHPISLEANWVFGITSGENKRHHVQGLKKALVIRIIFPLAVVLFLYYLYCWGIGPAAVHTLFSTAAAVLIMELYFYGYGKIPFTVPFNPSAVNLKLVWPLFLFIYLIASAVFVYFGGLLLFNPVATLIFFPSITIVIAAMEWYNLKRFNNGLIFEDQTIPLVLELNLN